MVMNILSALLFPPPSILVTAITAVTAVSSAMLGLSECKGKHLQYSKFWKAKSSRNSSSDQSKLLSAKLGMLLAYTPAFLSATASFWFFPNDGCRILLLKSALALHFLKRILEVLFVHKYSSKVVLDTAIAISIGYLSSTTMMIYFQHLSKGLPEPPIDLQNAGIALYLTGITGNFYHHYLLSKTRGKEETEYKIPKGGLFGLVICPHYLFEIIEFFGFGFISQTMYAMCTAMGTAFYLGARSYSTRKWYISKFEDFPHHVRALFPFVF